MKNFIFAFFIFSIPVPAISQTGYTIRYSHAYSLFTQGGTTYYGNERTETLYIDRDSISLYDYKPGRNKIKPVLGNKKIHHGIYSLIHVRKYLFENAWTKPFNLKEADWRNFNWKVLQDTIQLKGYSCKKAVADSVIAWFTESIPVLAGPADYTGLPGLILQIEDRSRDWFISAESVVKQTFRIVIPDMNLVPCNNCESKLGEIKRFFNR